MIKPALLSSAVTCLQSAQKLQLRETESGRGVKENLLGAIKLLACQNNPQSFYNKSSSSKIIIIITTAASSSCIFSDGVFCKVHKLKGRHLMEVMECQQHLRNSYERW